MTITVRLPNSFVFHHDYDITIDREQFVLENTAAGISYLIMHPNSFRTPDEWYEHVEHTGGVTPGLFTKILKGAFSHGQHRQASAALHSNPAPIPYQSSGRSTSRSSYEAYSLACDALNAGYVSHQTFTAYYKHLMNGGPALTMGSLMPYSGLGGGIAQAQTQANSYTQAVLAAQAQQMQGIGRLGYIPLSAVPSAPHPATTLKSGLPHPGEIIGWRAWIVNERDLELRSVVATVGWNPDEPMTGDPASGYGIHAYSNPHKPVLDSYVTSQILRPWVIGEIALWGDIIEHEDGYRAEFGRVWSFVTWHNVDQRTRDEISKRYLAWKDAAPPVSFDDEAA